MLNAYALRDIGFRCGVVMSDRKISPADEAILKYLRSQVDKLQDERHRMNARPSIPNELHIAIRDLREFTEKLRKAGKRI